MLAAKVTVPSKQKINDASVQRLDCVSDPQRPVEIFLCRVAAVHERLPRWDKVISCSRTPWLLLCSSSINQRHINVGQINHVPVEAHLKTRCMLCISKFGDCSPLLWHHFEHLYGTDGPEKVLQLNVSCG